MRKYLGFLAAGIALIHLMFPQPAYAAGTNFGFDFRATLGYVTDPNYASLVVNELFPHTYTNGLSQTISAGWTTISVSPCGAGVSQRDRNSGNDPRLAGVDQNNGNSTSTNQQCDFRVTLPATGVWTISAAFGDASNSQSQYIQLQDNGSSFATYTAVSTAGNSFMDANGTVWTEANWLTSQTTLNHTFTSTQFDVLVGPNSVTGSASSNIAYLNVTQSATNSAFQVGGFLVGP